jgi:hypothetical protein
VGGWRGSWEGGAQSIRRGAAAGGQAGQGASGPGGRGRTPGPHAPRPARARPKTPRPAAPRPPPGLATPPRPSSSARWSSRTRRSPSPAAAPAASWWWTPSSCAPWRASAASRMASRPSCLTSRGRTRRAATRRRPRERAPGRAPPRCPAPRRAAPRRAGRLGQAACGRRRVRGHRPVARVLPAPWQPHGCAPRPRSSFAFTQQFLGHSNAHLLSAECLGAEHRGTTGPLDKATATSMLSLKCAWTRASGHHLPAIRPASPCVPAVGQGRPAPRLRSIYRGYGYNARCLGTGNESGRRAAARASPPALEDKHALVLTCKAAQRRCPLGGGRGPQGSGELRLRLAAPNGKPVASGHARGGVSASEGGRATGMAAGSPTQL